MKIANVTFDELPHSRVKLSCTIPAEEVQISYQTTLQRYRANVEIKGFRKGKVPDNVILSRMQGDIYHDALQNALRRAVDAALKDKEYRTLEYDPPRLINKPDYDPVAPLAVEVAFDVFPRFTLPEYYGLTITIPEIQVGVADVQRELQQLQIAHARYEPKKKSAIVAKGDRVTVDVYRDEARGEAGAESDPLSRKLPINVGDSDAPSFALELVGLAVGEGKSVVDPSDSEKRLFMRVVSISVRDLPKLNNAFAVRLDKGLSSISDLKKRIRSELEEHSDFRLEGVKRARMLAHLIDTTSIDLPLSMIEIEKENTWHALCERNNTTSEEFERALEKEGKSKAVVFEGWHDQAIRLLKEGLIINAISAKEKLRVDQQAIDEYIAKRAKMSGHDAAVFKEVYQKNKRMDDLIADCADALLFRRLFETTEFVIDKSLNKE